MGLSVLTQGELCAEAGSEEESGSSPASSFYSATAAAEWHPEHRVSYLCEKEDVCAEHRASYRHHSVNVSFSGSH